MKDHKRQQLSDYHANIIMTPSEKSFDPGNTNYQATPSDLLSQKSTRSYNNIESFNN